jgi:hypothetical protein
MQRGNAALVEQQDNPIAKAIRRCPGQEEAVIKVEELRDSSSCMNRAKPMEMTFVLLARDITAPWVVRLWCILRVLLLKNKPRDAQVREAWKAASIMAQQRRQGVHKPLFTVEHRGFIAEAVSLHQ